MEPNSRGVFLPVEYFQISCRLGRGNSCAPFYRVRETRLHESVHRSDVDMGTRHSFSSTSPYSLRPEGWRRSRLGDPARVLNSPQGSAGRRCAANRRPDRNSRGKLGNTFSQAKKQIEGYALLLHYFHKASADQMIVPIIVSPEAGQLDLDLLRQDEMFPQLAIYWVRES